MGGMKYIVLLVLVVATTTSAYYTNGCTQRCPLCLLGTEYNEPIPSDVCSYCHCDSEAQQTVQRCPLKMEWNENAEACVPSTRCGYKVDPRCNTPDLHFCGPCYENMGLIYPAGNGSCGYCQCVGDEGHVEYHDCPPGTGWVGNECAPTERCCNECADTKCDPCYHGMRLRFPDHFDNCKFCCCEPISPGSTIEHGVVTDCPQDSIFSVSENKCVYTRNPVCNRQDPCPTTPRPPPPTTPMPTCPPPPKDCDVVCPPEHYGEHWLMPNPIDKCSFCCCVPDGSGGETPKTDTCKEHDAYFDPTEKRCRKSQNGECPATPLPPPTNCRPPGIRDGCELVKDNCKYDADGHIANPYDDASFCQCEFDRIHWMPCAGGTTRYSEKDGACI